MNISDRNLCFEFLMRVTNRTKEEAQQFLFTLGKPARAGLLKDAKEWKSMGYPVRGAGAVTAPVTDPERVFETPARSTPDVEGPARKKAKKVLFSLLLPPAELEALRTLSDETGETVSSHVRQAIRTYLKGAQQ
ncbi:hypothetical protein [Stutzerimonas chloritidismutans]|nr:MAG: hypothetical protein CVV07_15340 [Gammaproteobacteria bacterium HGW-Gammaproteobacteria-11]